MYLNVAKAKDRRFVLLEIGILSHFYRNVAADRLMNPYSLAMVRGWIEAAGEEFASNLVCVGVQNHQDKEEIIRAAKQYAVFRSLLI
jgi:hypothetical protein